jgi:MFS family permease
MNPGVWLMQQSCQANIEKFFAFRFLWEFQLFLPIWVIFVQQKHGFSLTQVTLLNVAFWLTMAAGEIPTGAVADVFGRKRSLLIAVMLAAASVSFFVLAPTYPLLMLANTLWALAMTFDSGAALALLYDSLRALRREGEYTRLRGRLAVVVHLAVALSSVLGGCWGLSIWHCRFSRMRLSWWLQRA